ncbi:MAG: hypothetical protein LLF96_00155 [Eubacteriales bacterium]|nr:hypothetical protein [Eubacteriales bacterium]
MFDDWINETNRYILKRLDRKPFRALDNELEQDIAELSNCYASVLLESGIIDSTGNGTGADMDEDDLLEAMLARFEAAHPADDERGLLYAALVDAYLTLVRETSEDL